MLHPNLNTVADVLRENGYSREQIAGVLGNLMAESGQNLNPTAIGDGGLAFGIAQWHPDRQAGLKRLAQEKGTSINDIRTQAEFIVRELNSSEKNAGNKLRQATTVEEATAAFIGFERPAGWSAGNPQGGHNWSGRLNYAEAIIGDLGAGPRAGVSYTVIHQTVGSTLSALDGQAAQTFADSKLGLEGKEAFTQMQGTLKLAELLQIQPEQLETIKQEMGLVSHEERKRINSLSDDEKTAYFENNQIITQNDEWYDLGKATIAVGSESEKLIQQTAEAYEGLDEAKKQALKEQNEEALKERATQEEQRILEAKQAAAAAAGAGMSEEMLMLMVLGAAFAYASGNNQLGDQIINNMFGGGEVLLPPSASIGSNTSSTNRQKYYDDTGRITYQSDTKGQFGFAGNGSFSGVDKRLVEIMEKTAQEFPLRVRVVSGKVGRSKGDHANGLAVDIVIYDDNGDPLGSYQNPHTHRVYELFAQAAYLNTQSMHPELVDGQGLDFQWGGLFGDGQDGGYKYGSHDSMDFRLATADRFRAGTIMDGLNSQHSWYDKGDFWGGSKPFSIEAFNNDIEALHGFRMTPEQKALNDGAMGRARNTVARHAGKLESRKEEPVASVALNSLPSNLQEVLKLADINRDGSITPDESKAVAQKPDSIDKIREVLTQEGVVEASNDNSPALSGDGLQRALEAAAKKHQKGDEASLQK